MNWVNFNTGAAKRVIGCFQRLRMKRKVAKMLADFDLVSVRQFITHLDSQRARCHIEGTFCSDLDEVLECHLRYCAELLGTVKSWAKSIFSGIAQFDPDVESAFKTSLEEAIRRSKPHVEQGFEVQNECLNSTRLHSLIACLREIEHLLGNWVAPQKSASPAYRVVPSPETSQQIRERVRELPPLGKK